MSYSVRTHLADADRTELAAGTVVGLALLAVPFVFGPSNTRLAITILLFGVFATTFNLLYGYTGLLSFGHAMFTAAAAYVAAKVFRVVGTSDVIGSLFGGVSVLVTFFIALALGILGAALVGVVIGWFCVRREEIYFALLTLSFSMLIWAILQQNVPGQLAPGGLADRVLATGGSDGLPVSFRLLGEVDLFVVQFELVDITSYLSYYYVVLLLVVLAMYAMWRIVNSPFGETCKAIRENPERAQALGIDRAFHSWMMFIVSGAFAGLAGALFMPLRGGAIPNIAHWSFSALPVVMTVIGGPYSFIGPAIGAFVFEFIRDLISAFPTLEQRWQLVFGLVLLGVVVYFENGVAGGLTRLRAWLGVARERYREDGTSGVASFVGDTVAGWLATVRTAFRERAVSVRSSLGIGD